MSRFFNSTLLLAGLVLAGSAQAAEQTVQHQVSADAHGQVIIDNVAGSIEVSGWDRSEVSAEAQLDTDLLRLAVTTQSGTAHVRVEGYGEHSLPGGAHGEARLRVWVPKDSQLSVTGVNADIHSRGVAGAQHLKAVNGDIDAELFAGAVDVRTVNGDIHLQGHGQQTRVSATSVSGNVLLTGGAGDLTATSVSGNLHLAIDPASAMRVRTTTGTIEVEGALAPMAMLDLNTVNGRIDLQVAAPAGFSYDVSSFSGDISDCFGQQAERAAQFGPGTRLSGTRGGGAGRLRVRTLTGKVSICDRAEHRP